MRGAAAVLACGLALLASGCGGDDEKSADTQTTTAPEVTAPGGTGTATTPAPAATPPRTAPPAKGSGDPESGGATAPSPPQTRPRDTPERDIPPPPGSPAERFERECEQNPGACG